MELELADVADEVDKIPSVPNRSTCQTLPLLI